MATSSQDLARLTEDLEYPIRKEILIERAVERGFDADEIQRALEATPVEEFNSPSSVTEAFAKLSHPGA